MHKCFLGVGHGLLGSKAFLVFNKGKKNPASIVFAFFLLDCEL